MREVDPGGGCQGVLILLVAMVTTMALLGTAWLAYTWANR